MIPLSLKSAKSIFLAFCLLALVAPSTAVQAKSRWAGVFEKYFQQTQKALEWVHPTQVQAASIESAEATFEVDLQPKRLRGPVRRFKKINREAVSSENIEGEQNEVMAPLNQEPLTRYTDFVVPESLITSLFEKLKTEKSTSKIVTPDEVRDFTHFVYDSQLRSQGIQELIGIGLSNFDYSSYERKHNIRNAVSKFDGLIIPKGEEFSFNDNLKNAGPSNGFLMAKIISKGMTKYGWGGGVCQVSTTVFRSAYNSGLPITARRNHTFKVPYYGQLAEEQGMDATIYLGGQDLKFVNDTPGDIMMQFVEKDDNLMVLFYGTKDRTVSVQGPQMQGMRYEWNRVVTFPDGDRWDEILKSQYQREIIPVVEKEPVDASQAKASDSVN
ncbi:MAG TPA: VanW family protein [Candidatus Gracilibacteria bacterium]